ncbi:DUF4190 domain-containing protein [Streptomyces erythrochromogenes]|uniref:DUF4190 domain-containing protein n=1 Tax=Streptomyces erythrochromogenes TaxID=285574 RepID=UPI00368B908F
MNDSSPEPRDPWAPPERPPVDLGKAQGDRGTPGVSGPPSVHDQPTLAGMPGEQTAPGAAPPAAGPASAAYGYPVAQPGYGYPAQGYPFPGAYQPYGRPPSNGFGITALVLGILAVVGCITSFIAVALGIAAVVFGALGKGKANRGEADNGGVALAGIILGAIGIALGLLMLFAMFAPFLDGGWDDGPNYESPYSDSRLHERV